MRINVVVVGAERTVRNLKRKGKRAVAAFERSIKKQAALVMRASLKIVPVDEGNLKASWFIRPRRSGAKTEVYIGYTAGYAIYVHEDTYALHGADYNDYYEDEIASGGKHSRGKNQQAKFLEKPFRAMRPLIMRNIRKDIRRALLK